MPDAGKHCESLGYLENHLKKGCPKVNHKECTRCKKRTSRLTSQHRLEIVPDAPGSPSSSRKAKRLATANKSSARRDFNTVITLRL